MRNLSVKEAIELAKQFKKCKTVDEQQKFCKTHNIELTFEDVENAQENTKKEEEVDDNQGSVTKDK